MTPFRVRLSGVTFLAGVVLLLLPVLAWLQYSWLGQVSEAERGRMQRTLRTAASQFGVDFDGELSRAMVGVQVDGPTLRDENWTAYAQKYSAWSDRAVDPRLVREVLLVDLPRRTRGDRDDRRDRRDVKAEELRLRRWNDDQRRFEPAEWSTELGVLPESLAHHMGELHDLRMQDGGRARREAALSFIVENDYTLVAPVTHFEFPEQRRSRPRMEILGFTLVRLDPGYILDTFLPMLAARHVPRTSTEADYRLAVTERDDPSRTIWESDEGAAAAIGSSPDVTHAFMSARPDHLFMLTRNIRTGPGAPDAGERIVISVLQDRRRPPPVDSAGPPNGPPRGFGTFEGRWQLAAVHRAGSLAAAVSSLRRRNLLLSSSILVLLTAAIGLIVVSAKRAQTLARQQMEFVAAVSHELRTPVSVIGTAAGNLADGVVADPARVRVYGETIQGEARRLAETVERVLQLAGIAAGRAAAARVQVDPSELVENALAQCRTEIDAAGVNVEVDIADGLPPVEGDAAALRAALQNLISNAVKYGGEAKWLRVSVSGNLSGNPKGLPLQGTGGGRTRGGNPSGSPSQTRGGNPLGLPTVISFSVSDHGFGIGGDDRKHIFEPFYRGREALARRIQGSGLGLNLVQRIAEAHGGRVTVASEPGKGSTFTLIIAAASPTLSGSAATASGEASVAVGPPLHTSSN